MNDKLLKLKNNSLDDDIPIMQDEGLNFLIELIKNKKIKKILEIGTAVGYSAIKMATVSSDIQITTIERDKARYDCARKNIKDFNLNSRINPIFADATELTIDDKYDLIFIDAAKGKNTLFFEKFKNNLNPDGYIVTDNLKFHGCVEKPLEEIESTILSMIESIFEKIAEQTRSTNAYLVEQVQNYLFQHMNENITLSDLGEIFGINYSSLSNIFSSATGQTIIEYLTFIRILHAKELLINTDKKIYEICSEIGYTEPKYFIKRFRQIVGVTPKEYRKIYTS